MTYTHLAMLSHVLGGKCSGTYLFCFFVLHFHHLLIKLHLQLLLELHGTREGLLQELLDPCFVRWSCLCILRVFRKLLYKEAEERVRGGEGGRGMRGDEEWRRKKKREEEGRRRRREGEKEGNKMREGKERVEEEEENEKGNSI